MLGCEPGAEGCFGRLLDPLTSGRVGGATWEGDVKNTHMSEKSGEGKCQGIEVSSGVEALCFQEHYTSQAQRKLYTTGRIYLFIYFLFFGI